jgi:uncharacterized delta-60 repeat protein
MNPTHWKRLMPIALCLLALVAHCGGSGTPPAAPANVSATLGAASGELVIAWDAVTGATSYNIYYGTETGITKSIGANKALGTKIENATSPYSHTGLIDGTTYYYIVTALDGSTESEASTEASSVPLLNAVGELDTTFNATGFYVSPQYNQSAINSIATDAAGKIFAGGQAKYPTAAERSATIWAFDVNGALDTAFGTDGITAGTHITSQNDDLGLAMAVDASGRFLLGGVAVLPTTFEFDAPVWRFNADGSPDTTFGAGKGYVILPDIAKADAYETISAMTVDSSGRIVLTGTSDAEMFVCRLLDTGDLDTAFGGGCVHSKGAAGGIQDLAKAIAIDAEGRIVVAGAGYDANSVWDMVLWRFTDAGVLDTSFDGDGIVVYHAADADIELAYGIAVETSGRIIAAGIASQKTQGDDGDVAVWAYDNAGTPDAAFGTGGVVLLNTGTTFEEVYGMTLDPRGNILVTGCESRVPGWTPTKAMDIVRFLSDGSVDTTFGTAGVVSYNSGDTVNDCGNAITTDFAGRIIVGGVTGPSSATIWRYR